jgi:hypothetical protein
MKTEPLRLIRTTTTTTLVVTCLALCLPYVRHGEWLWAVAALWFFAIALPVPDLPSWGRAVSNVTFAGTVILAGNAAAQLGSTMWALIAVTAATATWDLQHLIHRLRPFEPATSDLTSTSELASTSELTPTSELAPTSELTSTSELTPTSELTSTSELTPTSELAESAATTATLSDRERLVRSHLQRLATTLGISLALGSIALVVRVDYSIRTLAILTLVLLVGLGGAVAYLRRASD